MKINYLFTKSIIKSVKKNSIKSKLFFAGTSEMFGTNLKKNLMRKQNLNQSLLMVNLK